MDEPDMGGSSDTMHGCLQGNDQSDGSIYKLKFRTVVRGALQNK